MSQFCATEIDFLGQTKEIRIKNRQTTTTKQNLGRTDNASERKMYRKQTAERE